MRYARLIWYLIALAVLAYIIWLAILVCPDPIEIVERWGY